MELTFVNEQDLASIKANTLILWTDVAMKKFNANTLSLIKEEAEFLTEQFVNKKILKPNSALFCAGVVSNLDSYIAIAIYNDESKDLYRLNESTNNMIKTIKYVDIININSIIINTPKLKIDVSSFKNKFIIYRELLKKLMTTKVRKVYFLYDNDDDIKLIKRIKFLLSIPIIKNYV